MRTLGQICRASIIVVIVETKRQSKIRGNNIYEALHVQLYSIVNAVTINSIVMAAESNANVSA
jgi:hypothetical protein